MGWFRWTAATVEAVLILLLLLLWLDTLRDRVGWTTAMANRRAAPWALAIPVGFVAVLYTPIWLALVLLAVPILAILVMTLGD